MMPNTSADSDNDQQDQLKKQQQLLKGFMTCIKDNIYTDKEVVKKSWQNIQEKPIDINTLIDFQIDKNDQFAYQCNPLHVAVSVNNLAAVKALLELGANPNCADSKETRGRYVPLRIALNKRHFEIASILIRHGASPDSRSMYGSGQQMTLIDRDTKENLNKKYGSECVTNEEQLHPTLLRYYVESNKKEQAIFLIENNADLNPQIPLATLRAMMSGTKSRQDVNEDFLKTYAKENCPSLILEAYQKQMYKVVQAMLEKDKKHVDDKYPSQHQFAGNTMLHRATLENNLEIVEMLLHFGANPNEGNDEHEIPLTLVASRKKIDGDTLQIARLLILQSALQNPNVDETLAVTNPPNKTLINKINVMLYATACLQSVFRYAASIDEKLGAYNIHEDNILSTLINSRLNWLGNVAAINSKQDSDEMKGARVACANDFKKIIQQLTKIYGIFNGTMRDDFFLSTELIKKFLAKRDGNSIGYQFLVHKIQNQYPQNIYLHLYPKLLDPQEANQQSQASGGISGTETNSQPPPALDQETFVIPSENGERYTMGLSQPDISAPPSKPPPVPPRNSTPILTEGEQQPEESMETPLSVSTGPKASQPNTPAPPPLPPHITSTSTPTMQGEMTPPSQKPKNLLEQIQARQDDPLWGLKKVCQNTGNPKRESGNSLESRLENAIAQRRKSMKPGEKQDTEPKEEDNKEWSDNEDNGNSPPPRPSL